jgi:hypothetical protein
VVFFTAAFFPAAFFPAFFIADFFADASFAARTAAHRFLGSFDDALNARRTQPPLRWLLCPVSADGHGDTFRNAIAGHVADGRPSKIVEQDFLIVSFDFCCGFFPPVFDVVEPPSTQREDEFTADVRIIASSR